MTDNDHRYPIIAAMALAALALQSCAGNAPVPAGNATATPGASTCSEPRPQMCTMDYTPVCAVLKDSTQRTFSNGCSACSDPQVVSHTLGECP